MLVIIIAQDGITRNKELVSELLQIGHKVKIIQGFNSRLYEKKDLKSDILFSKVKLNHFSPGEIACAQAHLDAYGFLSSNLKKLTQEWFIIIEDDVEILDRNFLDHLVYFPKISFPVIMNLYSESFICLNSDNTFDKYRFRRSIVPTTSTVSYVINRPFLDLFKEKNRLIENRADWPFWITKHVRFYVAENFKFRPKEYNSLIGNLSFDDRSKKMFKFSTLNAILAANSKTKRIINSKHKLHTFKNEMLVIIMYIKEKASKLQIYQRGYW